MDARMGLKNRETKKKKETTIAVSPVRPPSCTGQQAQRCGDATVQVQRRSPPNHALNNQHNSLCLWSTERLLLSLSGSACYKRMGQHLGEPLPDCAALPVAPSYPSRCLKLEKSRYNARRDLSLSFPPT